MYKTLLVLTCHQAPPKKRRKLLATTTPGAQRPIDGLGTYEDALQSPILTAQVWEELVNARRHPSPVSLLTPPSLTFTKNTSPLISPFCTREPF